MADDPRAMDADAAVTMDAAGHGAVAAAADVGAEGVHVQIGDDADEVSKHPTFHHYFTYSSVIPLFLPILVTTYTRFI